MRKNKLIVLLMLAVVMAFSFAFTACNTDSDNTSSHVCGHKCPVCGYCLDEDCGDEACWDKCEAATLEKAAEKIRNDYKDLSETPADIDLVNATTIRDVGHTDTTISYTVSWKVEVAEGVVAPAEVAVKEEDGSVTLKITLRGAEAHPYTLVATVSDAEGNTKDVTFNLTVPVVQTVTVAQFLEKEVDSNTYYRIEGWVTAAAEIGKNGSFILEDSTGAIFSYNKFEVTLGEKYAVCGTRAVNYDLPQIGTTNVEKLSSSETFTPPQATELSGADLTENPITKANVLTYSVKPLKIIGSKLVVNDNGYYITNYKDKQLLNLYMNSTIKTAAEALKDNEVIVYGYLRGFSTSYYTIQVTAIEKAPVVELTDAQKIAAAKEDLTVADIFDAGSVELPTAADDVTIAWSLAETTLATLTGNTLTVANLPDTDKTITLTATLSIGEISATKDITVNIKLAKSKYLADVVATPAVGTTYKLAMWHNVEKKVYYTIGAVSGRYISTTTDVTKAVDVTLEAATGGYYVKLGDEYLTIVGEKYNNNLSTSAPTLADTATTVFTVRTDGVLTFVASLEGFDDGTYYLGTSGTYTTVGSNAISKISDTTKIDNSQYVVRLVQGTKINEEEISAADISIDCSDGQTGITLSADGTQKSFTKNGVLFVNDKASSSSDVTTSYDSNGSIRCYKSTTVTIGCAGMTKIVITTDSNNKFSGLETLTVEGDADVTATLTVDGTTATIVFTSAVDSVTITLSQQKVFFKNIDIYKAA